MKKLKVEMRNAILEQVRFEPEALRKYSKGTGAIMFPIAWIHGTWLWFQ